MDLSSWYKINSGNIYLYKAWNMEQSGIIVHGLTSRIGGCSKPPYGTLNLALHVGDDYLSVMNNRQLIAASVGFDLSAMTCAEQVHGSTVAVVGADDVGRGADRFSESIAGVDALITDKIGPVLCLFYADCVPVYILDPVKNAIGLAHAGWKGTALGIAVETVKAMVSNYNTNPSDCLAAIGPSISRCCYEVSHDVASKVVQAAGDDRVLAQISVDKMAVDLKLANWLILRQAGIQESNIAVSSLCTSCNSEEFFSYRREGATGRMMAFIFLRNR